MTAVLAGATGLVGGELLRLLLASPRYARVVVVTRRALSLSSSPKLEPVVVDFAELDAHRRRLRAEHVFCALGTTIARAGSRAAFRKVDHDHVLQLAELTRRQGARHFSLVSALGADPRSAFFYSRVKGETERDLRAMDWPSLALLRPSLITGERRESRPLERLGGRLLRHAPAPWRPVSASVIAGAMLAIAVDEPPGCTIVASREMADLAGQTA